MSTVSPRLFGRGMAVTSVAIVGILAGAGLRLQQPAAPRVTGPTRVAIVDTSAVLKALAETKDLQSKLDAHLDEAKKQVGPIEDQIKKITDDLKMMKDTTTPEARDKAAKLYVLNAEDRALRASLGQLIDEENGGLVRAIYLKIIEATQMIADRDHWDLVIKDDRSVVPPEKLKDNDGREHPITAQDVTRIVDQREILAANAGIDITQDVITQMNNDYAKGANAKK